MIYFLYDVNFIDLSPVTADMIEPRSEILATETEQSQKIIQCLLKLMSSPKLLHSLTVRHVRRCYHISCVKSNLVWFSGDNNLILTKTRGVLLHRVEDSCNDLYGLHTVSNENELIYIDMKYNINKLSKDLKTSTTFIERKDSILGALCVYWSTGDLLVGIDK